MTPERSSLSQSQEFREDVLESLARIEERQSNYGRSFNDLSEKVTSGAVCIAGAKHEVKIEALEEQTDKQWKVINSVRNPARKGLLIGAGGTLSMAGLFEIVKWIWETIHKTAT